MLPRITSWTIILAMAMAAQASLNKDGMRGVDKVHSAQTLGHSRMGIGLFADGTNDAGVFQDKVLTRTRNPGEASPWDTVDTRSEVTGFWGIGVSPFLSIGLGNYVDLGAMLPIYYDGVSTQTLSLWNEGEGHVPGTQHTPITGTKKTYIGDIQFNFKVRAPIPQDEYIVDVALLLGGTLATTNRSKQGLWLREIDYVTVDNGGVSAFGNESSTIKGTGILTLDFNRLEDPLPFVLNLNGGYRAPSDSKFSPVSYYGASLELTPVDFISVYGEYWHEAASKKIKSGGVDYDLKLDYVNTGVILHTDAGIEIYVSANMNMNSGGFISDVNTTRVINNQTDTLVYGTRIRPDLWATVGFTWNGFLLPQDRDKDGVLDKNDKCPDDPEDEDDFQDDDGCPDPDNDKDGIPDVDDECPLQAEDVDNFQDEDGCPDPDNDGDGVLDAQDKCPADVEDKDGFQDEDGCPDPDNDGDGFLDEDDKCPNAAETKNGIDDEDGCPEGDADFDGILDKDDKCPTQAEDRDGFQDEDGCPDPDNDGDGILDKDDKCPNDAETKNGIQDEDGCPEGDVDNDGVRDSVDQCPTQPEDRDGFQDEDGCPDPDNDGDGILDKDDKCPNDKEVINGIDDEDGCPDSKPIEKQITLRGVNFKSGTADLTPDSRMILDPIVEQLRTQPNVRIEIQGHTDNVGSDASNQKLSERRAKAVVDYFVFQGIERSRMKATGYGESMPIADNKTAEGRALNRRIEMKRID